MASTEIETDEGASLKTVDRMKPVRGFESLPLRLP